MTLFDLLNPIPACALFYQRRELLWQFTKRNVSARYRGSVLGIFWSFVQPLMMLCVYTFVFTFVFKAKFGDALVADTRGSFAIIMFAGMAVFNMFSESVVGSCGVISANPNFVKKVIFPLEILPMAQALSSVIFGCIWFLLLMLGVFVVLKTAAWTMLLLPLVLIPLAIFSCGCAFFTASVGAYLRDLQHLITVLVQVLFFMTPIFYPLTAVPERFRWILKLNPLCWIVEETRQLFLFGELPDWKWIAVIWIAALLMFHLGFLWFSKVKKGFADVL